MFAKSQNGKFILRIEDTDRTRLVPGAIENLQEMLSWCGLIPDEGPSHLGKHGPYLQSQRLPLYQEKAKELLKNETAYYCFCTEQRLNLIRKEALKNRETPKYDNKCRNLSSKDVLEKLAHGTQYCVRFKLDQLVTFDDIIHGIISHDVSDVEGDPVIMKTDGYPTYHFANVVDDHFMEITHVLRGIEWQSSTVKHLLLYRAFCWEPPKFAHLPLLLNKDGTKLSKRQDDLHVHQLKLNGYFSEPVLNFITNSGGGFGRTSKVVYSLPELSRRFQLSKVNTNSSRLNFDQLKRLNRQFLQQQLVRSGEDLQELIRFTKNFVQEKFADRLSVGTESQACTFTDEYVGSVLNCLSSRIFSLNDLVEPHLEFVWFAPQQIKTKNIQLSGNTPSELLSVAVEYCESMPKEEFVKENINVSLRSFCKQNHIHYNSCMKLIRSALSGLSQGPSVAEMLELLGKENSIRRLKAAAEQLLW